MTEIKEAADSIFATCPYHEITLSVIAERLSWTRANLYRYVSTKEEIFLELTEDRMAEYYEAMLAAYPEGCGYTPEVLAEVWSGILAAHTDYLRYGSILSSIIETNVSVERLATFKTRYYGLADALSSRLSSNLGISEERAGWIQVSAFFQGIGLVGACYESPQLRAALELANINRPHPDLRTALRDFILMSLRDALSRRRVPVFAYGTLTDPGIRGRVLGRDTEAVDAVARGYTRMVAGDYMTIVPSDGDVQGVVFHADPEDLRRMDLWEEVPVYTLEPVTVEVGGEEIDAFVYVMSDPVGLRPAEPGAVAAVPMSVVEADLERLLGGAPGRRRPPRPGPPRRPPRSPGRRGPRPRTPDGPSSRRGRC